jgi:hypothetical protein
VLNVTAQNNPNNVEATGSYTAGVLQSFRAVINLDAQPVPTFDLFIDGVQVRDDASARGEFVDFRTFSFSFIGSFEVVRSFGLDNVRITRGQEVDTDGDGFPDGADNCPNVPNNQSDLDGDGIGDVCDPTPTGPELADPGQAATASTVLTPPSVNVGSPIRLQACVTAFPGPVPYFFVRPQAERMVIEVRDALGNLVPAIQVVEPPLLVLATPPDGDLVEILPGSAPQTFCVEVLVTERYGLSFGQYRITARYYTKGIKDPDLTNDGDCQAASGDPNDCYEPILQIDAPAGEVIVSVRDDGLGVSQIDDLITLLQGLNINRLIRAALIAQLRLARVAVLRGHINVACVLLKALLHEVAFLSEKNKLTPAQASLLTAAINAIRASLVCG